MNAGDGLLYDGTDQERPAKRITAFGTMHSTIEIIVVL
jgi:hypothetical protein